MTVSLFQYLLTVLKIVFRQKPNTKGMVKKMKSIKKSFAVSIVLLAAFIIWTVAICFIDVRTIGPQGSSVGFATINQIIHDMTGVHFCLYNITDWLSLLPIFVSMGFGILGLVQWIKRKSICKVDFSILVLGVFYIVTVFVFLFFENVVIPLPVTPASSRSTLSTTSVSSGPA